MGARKNRVVCDVARVAVGVMPAARGSHCYRGQWGEKSWQHVEVNAESCEFRDLASPAVMRIRSLYQTPMTMSGPSEARSSLWGACPDRYGFMEMFRQWGSTRNR